MLRNLLLAVALVSFTAIGHASPMRINLAGIDSDSQSSVEIDFTVETQQFQSMSLDIGPLLGDPRLLVRAFDIAGLPLTDGIVLINGESAWQQTEEMTARFKGDIRVETATLAA